MADQCSHAVGRTKRHEWVMGFFVGAMLICGVRNIIARRESALRVCMLAGFLTCVLEPRLMYFYKFIYPHVARFVVGMSLLVAAEVALEIISIRAGVWLYFGDQPFTIEDFPVHVAVIVGCSCVVLGSIAQIWFSRINGAKQQSMLVICPFSMIGVFNVFAYPVAFALASGGGVSAPRVGALVSMALSLTLVFICAQRLARFRQVE